MTGVTHGADAERLLEVADGLRGQGTRVREIGDSLSPLAEVLRDSWSGPDSEEVLAGVDDLRPAVASTGATLLAWADALKGQVDEQRRASGESGGITAGGGGRPSAIDPLRTVREFADFMGRGPDKEPGDGGSPWLAALGDPRRNQQPGGASDNVAPSGWDPLDLLMGKDVPGYNGPEGSRSKSLGKGVSIEVSGSAKREDAGLNSQGQPLESTTVTSKVELSGEAGKRFGKVGLEGKGFVGTENSYQVTGVEGTDLTSANPFAPEGMPEGSSVRLSSSWYKGYELDGTFRNIVADMGSTSGTEHYVEITRGEGDKVTVRIGNEEFDKANGSVGLGAGPASLTMDAGGSNAHGTANEVTFDLSTPAGQEAYDRFVFGGRVPAADADGVVDVAKVEAFSGSKTAGMSANWGDKSASFDWVKNDSYSGVTKTHADGGQTVEWSSRREGSSVGGSFELLPGGQVVPGSERISFGQTNVPASEVQKYMEYRGSDATITTNQNVVITYTPSDIHKMRLQAADFYAWNANHAPHAYPGIFDGGREWSGVSVLDRMAELEKQSPGMVSVDLSSSAAMLTAVDEDLAITRLSHDPVGIPAEIAANYRATGKEPEVLGEVVTHPSK